MLPGAWTNLSGLRNLPNKGSYILPFLPSLKLRQAGLPSPLLRQAGMLIRPKASRCSWPVYPLSIWCVEARPVYVRLAGLRRRPLLKLRQAKHASKLISSASAGVATVTFINFFLDHGKLIKPGKIPAVSCNLQQVEFVCRGRWFVLIKDGHVVRPGYEAYLS